jgi:hypothetical protein
VVYVVEVLLAAAFALMTWLCVTRVRSIRAAAWLCVGMILTSYVVLGALVLRGDVSGLGFGLYAIAGIPINRAIVRRVAAEGAPWRFRVRRRA